MADRIFKRSLALSGFLVCLLLAAIVLTLFWRSLPAIQEQGFTHIFSANWEPNMGQFGSKPFIWGTLITSFVALLLSIPFSIALAIFLGEYFKKGMIPSFVKSCIHLLAGIPSVIYGFWGLFILVPIMRNVQEFFGIEPFGVGLLTASIILTIMIIPFSISMAQEVIEMVPNDLKEAAYSLGATQYEVITKVILPYSKSGIIAGTLLSFGRAVGETMAVTMLIGNSNVMPSSLWGPGNTLASVIANEFSEATHSLHVAGLVQLGLILFLLTFVINLVGKWILRKLKHELNP